MNSPICETIDGTLFLSRLLDVWMATLSKVLERRANPKVLVDDRKRRDLSLAERSMRELSQSLLRGGIKTSLSGNSLRIISGGKRVVLLLDKVDFIDLSRVLAENPDEIFVICWKASESVIRRAMEEEIGLAILSRRQVIHRGSKLSEAVLKVMSSFGLTLSEFESVVEGEDQWERETELLAELITLREVYAEHVRAVRLKPTVKALLKELREMAEKGADESLMNELLLAVLEAYPVEVDDRHSGKPGYPDVIAYSPLWILMELKNERASKQHVEQARGYLDKYRGEGSTPLEVDWRGLLVATDVPPEVYSAAIRADIRVMRWEKLLSFLEEVFEGVIPIYVLRDSLESDDPETELLKMVNDWKRRIEVRKWVLKLLSQGGAEEEQIVEMSPEGVEPEEVRKALVELSSPLLSLIREEGDFFFLVEGNPLRRAEWALSYLGDGYD